MNKFIVTNTCLGGEYTPSIFSKKDEALKWILECTSQNIRIAYGSNKNKLDSLTNEEVIVWAQTNLSNFKFSEKSSYIEYSDGTYNLMNLYEI